MNQRVSSGFRRSVGLACLVVMVGIAVGGGEARANGGPEDRTFGLGLQVGVPSGITGKFFLSDVPALQFGLGESMPFGGLGGWLDIVFHIIEFHHHREDVFRMSLYIGPGVSVGFAGPYYYQMVSGHGTYGGNYISGPAAFAIRFPIGFAIHWQKVPFDTVAELVPSIALSPGTYFAPSASIAARYYFF